MAKDLYFIKLGGSIITDTSRPEVAKPKVMKRIFSEIKEATEKKDFDILIGHGGGSFPHMPAHKYRVHLGLINKNSKKGASITQDAAARLNRIVVSELLKLRVNVISFPPSGGAVASHGKIVQWDVSPIKHALKNRFVPVTYGDVAMDGDQGVCIISTEEAFSFLSSRFRPKKIILATDVDGLFDKDPRTNPDAKLIRTVDGRSIRKLLKYASGPGKINVTGGMHTKLLLLHNLVKKNHAVGYIINGNRKGAVRDVLLGRKVIGTKVLP